MQSNPSHLTVKESDGGTGGYNTDLAFVSDSIAHQTEKCVMVAIPKTQPRPIGI